MRALLVVNHQATTTSKRSRDVLVRALRSEVDVEVAHTRRRGHAAALAHQGAADGIDLVVSLGGDGTVNEVVNGLLAVGDRAADRPALAVVPGGSTNVFARALGVPPDWPEATGAILEALRDGRERVIGLGRADDRYFTFCAGFGVDAGVIRRVEQARMRGRRSTPALYLRATVSQFLQHRDRRHRTITASVNGEEETRLAGVIVQNTAPWTYLFDRPVDPSPAASFELGLDVLAVRALKVPATIGTIGHILSRRGVATGANAVHWHDVSSVSLRTDRPQPLQIDGDYVGERRKVRFSAVPDALRVVC